MNQVRALKFKSKTYLLQSSLVKKLINSDQTLIYNLNIVSM